MGDLNCTIPQKRHFQEGQKLVKSDHIDVRLGYHGPKVG